MDDDGRPPLLDGLSHRVVSGLRCLRRLLVAVVVNVRDDGRRRLSERGEGESGVDRDGTGGEGSDGESGRQGNSERSAEGARALEGEFLSEEGRGGESCEVESEEVAREMRGVGDSRYDGEIFTSEVEVRMREGVGVSVSLSKGKGRGQESQRTLSKTRRRRDETRLRLTKYAPSTRQCQQPPCSSSSLDATADSDESDRSLTVLSARICLERLTARSCEREEAKEQE